MEEAIARRKQEKEQWGTVLSGREGGSLSGLPGLTQPGTGAVGDLSGLTTLSPDSLTTAQQPETSAQQPEVRGWVKDSQGKWVWLSGQESGQQPNRKPNWKPNWKPNKWVTLHDYGPWDPFHESAYYDLYHDSASSDSAWMYDYEG